MLSIIFIRCTVFVTKIFEKVVMKKRTKELIEKIEDDVNL